MPGGMAGQQVGMESAKFNWETLLNPKCQGATNASKIQHETESPGMQLLSHYETLKAKFEDK